jgi:hypothetical protein
LRTLKKRNRILKRKLNKICWKHKKKTI